MRAFSVGALIFIGTSAVQACLWDNDTLAEEAKNKMDFVRVITGRFDRNPPLYYNMRLERVAKELASDPADLENYDNAAVACDRLGDDKTAIEWIEKKRAFMSSHGITPKSNAEAWYRFYANAGTFHAHLWFRQGANPKDRRELENGRDLIAKALEINPNAHFGRERAQLTSIDWLIERTDETLDQYFNERSRKGRAELEQDAKGLAGLVMLGNGWQSVDLFAALANRLSRVRDSSLAQFAQLRAIELVNGGAKSIATLDPKKDIYLFGSPDDAVAAFNKKEFARLRAEADAWSSKREAFMMARLKDGRHPDTDPSFWQGYTEAPAPEVRSQAYLTTPRGRTAINVAIFAVAVVGIVVLLLLVADYLRRRLRRARS